LNIKFIITLAIIGVVCGIAGVNYYKETPVTEPPISVNTSPYQNSIYAKGVIELPPGISEGAAAPYLLVKCFVNEIVVPDLPVAASLTATLFLRGGNFEGLPLEFVKVEPAIVPDTELANGSRGLPVFFKFVKPGNYNIYPGQSVDVYIKGT
jgi:hypothetical protein